MRDFLTIGYVNKDNRDEPRIYVASLSDYNNGRLHGAWLDAAQDVEDVREDIARMLASSPEPIAEDYAIHDHEGFAPLSVHEFEDLEAVGNAARLIAEHRGVAAQLLADLGGIGQAEQARALIEEDSAGAWDSLDEWVEDLIDEGIFGEVSGGLRPYIDAERLGADMEMGGDILTVAADGKVHVFWNR